MVRSNFKAPFDGGGLSDEGREGAVVAGRAVRRGGGGRGGGRPFVARPPPSSPTSATATPPASTEATSWREARALQPAFAEVAQNNHVIICCYELMSGILAGARA